MSAVEASTYSSEGATSARCLPPISTEKGGLETPDTGTPPPRSVSPSSDGGVSLPPSERSAATLEGAPRRQRAKEAAPGGDEASLTSGGADAAAGTSSALPAASTASNQAAQPATTSAQPGQSPKAAVRGKKSKQKAGDAQAADDQALEAPVATGPVGPVGPVFGGFAMGMPGAMPREAAGGLFGAGGNTSFSDRRIIEVLSAPASSHKRLLTTAKRVPEIILSDTEGPALSANVELYGSLSLDMTEPDGRAERAEGLQDWASYYINGRSDVDFVVEVKGGTLPSEICDRLMSKGHWTKISETQVHKFASTQYTLQGSFDEGAEDSEGAKVYLDITCIESPLHYSRFKQRQEAFRAVFTDVRYSMEAQFSAQGALAFDAYVHLLKAFAAKVPGNALTGFQATCIGLFTLQIGHYRFKHNQSIALSLFEGFLRFCRYFFGDAPQCTPNTYWHFHYKTCGIDLSSSRRWLPRMNHCWRSELYFMAAEEKMSTRLDERVNVLHSLDPARVSVEASALLSRAFGQGPPCASWFSNAPAPAVPTTPV